MVQIPKELIESLKSLPDFDETAFVQAHDEANRITSLRLNPFKKTGLDFELGTAVKWCSDGFYLPERPSFTYDPLFHAGCYYVQEAGSMFIDHAIRSVVPVADRINALDLCAAPGGKSTLINSVIGSESLLVANEIVKSRSGVLAMNLSKWGTSNTIVTNNEPSRLGTLEGLFDLIVVDAPCSGSGLFRKQPEAVEEWSPDQVTACSLRQKKILSDVLPALKKEGILIYSTCSYSEEENESVVKWLIAEMGFEYLPVPVKNDWGIIESALGYRFYPHLTKSEGFFCAVLRKNTDQNPLKMPKIGDFKPSKQETQLISELFSLKTSLLYKNGAFYHGMSEAVFKFVMSFKKDLFFRKAGVLLGEIKGKGLVPDQELAWSLEVNPENCLELSKDDCIRYLKKETISSPVQNTGFSLVTYKGRGIGWAKTLSNRVNNYLPNELRIVN